MFFSFTACVCLVDVGTAINFDIHIVLARIHMTVYAIVIYALVANYFWRQPASALLRRLLTKAIFLIKKIL